MKYKIGKNQSGEGNEKKIIIYETIEKQVY